MCCQCLWTDPFCSTASHFLELWAILRKSAPNEPTWPWTLQGQRYPIYMYVLLVSPSPRFHFILLYDQPFSSYRLFWDKTHQNDPNITCTLNTTRPKVAHICYDCLWIPNFSKFCFTTINFRVTGHFEASAPNSPKVTLNTTRSKVPRICVTNVTQSPNFTRIFLYDQPFSRYKVTDNRKATEWP